MTPAKNRTVELIDALEKMLALLERERVAVAAFALDQIPLITVEKQTALNALAALSGAARSDEGASKSERDLAVKLFHRVQQRGHANMLLLHSVNKALATHLGLHDEGDLYNARARRQSAYAPRRARAY